MVKNKNGIFNCEGKPSGVGNGWTNFSLNMNYNDEYNLI